MSERMSGEVNILMIVWGLCGRVRDAILSIDLDVRTTSMRRWWLGLMSKTEAERLIVPSTYNTRVFKLKLNRIRKSGINNIENSPPHPQIATGPIYPLVFPFSVSHKSLSAVPFNLLGNNSNFVSNSAWLKAHIQQFSACDCWSFKVGKTHK